MLKKTTFDDFSKALIKVFIIISLLIVSVNTLTWLEVSEVHSKWQAYNSTIKTSDSIDISSQSEFAEAIDRAVFLAIFAVLSSLIFLSVFIKILLTQLKRVNTNLEKATLQVKSIADGKLDKYIRTPTNEDETSRLIQAVNTLQKRLSLLLEVSISTNSNLTELENDQPGFYQSITEAINKTDNSGKACISEASQIMSAMAKGDFSQRMKSSVPDEYLELQKNVNKTVESLAELMEKDLPHQLQSIVNGDFSLQP